MKITKVMLATIATFMLTWILVSLLCSYLFESEFRTTMNHSFIFMLILGWVPSVVVGMDLNDKLSEI